MNNQLQDQLIKDFPELFKGSSEPPTKSLMCFGCECGDGWYDLIRNVCEKIKDESDVYFLQIKEKFGGLRMYISSGSSKTHSIIDKAEEKSFKICEICGKPGKTKNEGWLRTLCEECRNEK